LNHCADWIGADRGGRIAARHEAGGRNGRKRHAIARNPLI